MSYFDPEQHGFFDLVLSLWSRKLIVLDRVPGRVSSFAASRLP